MYLQNYENSFYPEIAIVWLPKLGINGYLSIGGEEEKSVFDDASESFQTRTANRMQTHKHGLGGVGREGVR